MKCYLCDDGEDGLCSACVKKLTDENMIAMKCRGCGSKGFVPRTRTLLEKLSIIFGQDFVESVRFYEILIVFTPACPICVTNTLNIFRCYLGDELAMNWLLRNYELRAIYLFRGKCFGEECRLVSYDE